MKYARATLREVKAAHGDVKDRIVDLEPRAIKTLARLHDGQTAGPVFKRGDGEAWHADPRISGAQVNRAFQAAAMAAGLNRHVHLHMIRHSWASWHYAVNKDLKKLQVDGAWESLDMANRYSHLAPEGMVPEILQFWARAAATKARRARKG